MTSYIQDEDLIRAVDIFGSILAEDASRRQLFNLASAKFLQGDGVYDAKELALLGTLMEYITDWTKLNMSDLCGLVEPTCYIWDLQNNLEHYRRLVGYDNSYGGFANTIAKRTVLSKLVQAAESHCSPTTTARRKRRNANEPLTCSTILQELQQIANKDVSKFENLHQDEFVACAYHLGRIGNFSAAQWTALANKAIVAWGAVDTWDLDKRLDVAGIVSGLSIANIGKLVLNDANAIHEIGKNGLWTDGEKIKAFANRVLASYKNDNASTVTSTDLKSFGHFACGLETGKIAKIPTANVCKAVSSFGSLETCSEQQQQEYVKHLKTAGGDCFGTTVSGWSEANIARMGNMFGGLTKQDIATVTAAQLKTVSPQTIRNIPPMTFNGLSKSQIEGMNLLQAASISHDQYQSLDKDKQTVVTSKLEAIASEISNPAEDPDDPDKKNGCGILEASGLLLLTTLLAVFLRI